MKLSLSATKSTKATLLFTLLLFSFLLVSCTLNWSASYGSVLLVAGLVFAAILLVVAVRATVVTWITVLVLLTVAGNRRRVLVKQGRKITTDVAVYLVKVLLREKGLVAVVCAAILSFMAMLPIREAKY